MSSLLCLHKRSNHGFILHEGERERTATDYSRRGVQIALSLYFQCGLCKQTGGCGAEKQEESESGKGSLKFNQTFCKQQNRTAERRPTTERRVSHLRERSDWSARTNETGSVRHGARLCSSIGRTFSVICCCYSFPSLFVRACACVPDDLIDGSTAALLPHKEKIALISRCIFISRRCLFNGSLGVDKDKRNSP